MGHLICALRGGAIATRRAELGAVHDYLVQHASTALGAAQNGAPSGWGSAIKRTRVSLPSVGRPELVEAGETHNLIEVVNQCATLERLLDALAWIEQEPRFYGAVIRVCHPSTSSDAAAEENDHDLVLELADGSLAKFEVSDVVTSESDSNQKEKKDLQSLGVLSNAAGALTPTAFPSGHLFLIVSSEFASRLMRPTRHVLKTGWCHYRDVGCGTATRVLEIHQGPSPS